MDRRITGDQVIAKLIRGIAKYLSPHPFVDILSIHLGHTLIEAATFYAHRPLAVRWKEPLANKWLVDKLKRSLRFPRLDNWMNQEIEKRTVLGKTFNKLFTNMADQYYMLNLGFNGVSESKNTLVHLTENEEMDAKLFMKTYDLKEGNYVCFCIRDETYYQKYKTDLGTIDPNADFTFRNANINDYIPCAELLVQKGFKVVKMGFSGIQQKSSGDSNSIFIDPSKDEKYRPWIEAYLFKHCTFCVGMMTGGTLYASIFSRPVLWTDIFWRGTPIGKKTDMIVPKLILRKEAGEKGEKILNLIEIRQLGPPPDNNWNHFAKRGLKVQNCSPDELSNGVLDMIAFLKSGKYFNSKKDKANHQKFSAIHFKKPKRTIVVPTRLAPSWAKKYSKLLSTGSSAHETSQLLYNDFWKKGWDDEYFFNKRFHEKKTDLLFQMRIRPCQNMPLARGKSAQ